MSGKNEGDNLILFSYCSYPNQQWYLEKQSNGYYVIRNLCSNLVLGVENNSTQNGANIAQYIYNGSKSQQWKIENINGYYKIINCNSGKALEVEGAKCYNGANISQNVYCGKDNQFWINIPHDRNGEFEPRWQQRPLESVYAVVFMDAIHYHVRSEGQIVKRLFT